jgi:hypothetical protein
MNSFPSIDNLGRDIRFAFRQILRSPAFASIAIFTLALGIGANAAIFSLVDALKEGGASSTTESGRRRLRNGLVVSEIALALVLLAGAGLLVRTFLRLMQVDLGIDPTNVVTMLAALAACYVPAWRAMHVEPVRALRME